MKFILRILVLIVSFYCHAQDNVSSVESFNKWSFEFNIGLNKAVRPFDDGYFSSNPSRLVTFDGVSHIDIGARYMLTEVFGFKTDFAYDVFKNQSGTSSFSFNSKQYRLGLQAVVNLSKLFKFDSFTNRVSLLCHSGLQVSKFDSDGVYDLSDSEEKNFGVMFGLTPQFKVSRSLAFTLDFTVINNFRQHLNWNGTPADVSYNLNGLFYCSSVGLAYYFGKNNLQHADWVPTEPIVSNVDSLVKRLNNLESEIREKKSLVVKPTDTSELAINTKNQLLPKDYISKLDISSLDVFFDKSSDEVKTEFVGNILKVISILKTYPNLKLVIIGHSDPNGKLNQNVELSVRRARKVANIIIKENINPDRISFTGQGVDQTKSVSDFGNKLARRVSFEFITD